MPARKLKPILNNKISKVYVIVGTLVAQQTLERASVKNGHLVPENWGT